MIVYLKLSVIVSRRIIFTAVNSSLVAHVIQARLPSPGKRPFHDHDHDQNPESRSSALQITVLGGKCIPAIIFIGIWGSYAKSLLS
jgi:hypothetical protein